jgi:hypothetical protein
VRHLFCDASAAFSNAESAAGGGDDSGELLV